ncbi:MAG: ParB/RepB/Spo0J family partition protein [Marmoricola sp.]|nr:ParB/RepB/Spo0J family partition protein [Marmoricola sp.]
MNQPVQRRGLGRGLGSLIPTAPPAQSSPRSEPGSSYGSAAMGAAEAAGGVGDSGGLRAASAPAATPAVEQPVEVSGAYFAELPVRSIVPNARQPREVFDTDAMSELVHSVKEIGLLQPIVVRRTGQDEAGEPAFELIMGERRWRATQEAGLDVIPAIVRQTGDDAMLRDALLENLHRSQLNPLEEAAAYRQLLDDFGCTHDELAGRIGRSRPQISNTLRLLNLSPAVQRRVGAGVLSAGHARALLGVSDPGAQDRLASKVVSEGISVRGLEEIVAVGDHGDTEDADGVKVRPARPSAPGLAELNDRLSDRLDTRVKVTLGRSKGKIAIEFASLTDLERIVAVIDPRNREDRPI